MLRASTGNAKEFFESHGSVWNLIGRVYFHLAENKSDESAPFIFLATYSHQLSGQGKARYLPLGKALQEYAGERNKNALLQLLLPVQKSSQGSSFLKGLVDSGEIFHPLVWTPEEAFEFLKDIPRFESAGVIVRTPSLRKSSSRNSKKRSPSKKISIRKSQHNPAAIKKVYIRNFLFFVQVIMSVLASTRA